jgi:urease accessory protein UreF
VKSAQAGANLVPEFDSRQPAQAWNLRGDAASLTARLGDAGLLLHSGETSLRRSHFPIRDLPALRQFLRSYRDDVLLPRELPWILEAWRCADLFQPRELIELDQRLAQEPWIRELSVASQHVGRSQLRSLKPLRDLRIVQRYRDAVRRRQAEGWHVIVYGIVLHTYSIPVRPGLAGYAVQALEGFLDSGSRPFELSVADRNVLLDELLAPLPAGINRLLPPGPVPG